MLGANSSKSNKGEANMQLQQQWSVKSENKDSGTGFTPPFGSANNSALVTTKNSSEYHYSKSGPLSPIAVVSPLNKGFSPKAEALAEAHRLRVEAEAQAYLESEIRKLEAKAHKLQAKAERQKMHEESKVLEGRKREELRAEQIIQIAEAKADKILSKAREEAHRIKAHASEQTEKIIADAYTRAERWKAEIEETKKKELAEVSDRVQQMIAIGKLPSQDHRGVMERMKQSWTCHV